MPAYFVKPFFFEPDEFVNLVSELISRKCYVYISSFGYIQNIIDILDLFFESYDQKSPFTENNVLALTDINQDILRRQKKQNFLKQIADSHQGERILFFDDDPANLVVQSNPLVFGVKLGGHKTKDHNSFNKMGFHNSILEEIEKYTTHILRLKRDLNQVDKENILDIVMKPPQPPPRRRNMITGGGGKTKKTRIGKKQKTHKKQNDGKKQKTYKK